MITATRSLTPAEKADLFGQLIVAARETKSVARTAIGSLAELNGIANHVRTYEPALVQEFLAWCAFRALTVAGATSNGVHVKSAQFVVEYSRNGVLISES